MFIGQQKLWTLLDVLIEKMKEGENINIMFRAPSGYGKTKMAVIAATEVTNESDIQYELPDSNGEVYLDTSKRIIIIDEVHEMKQPELIYPLLDSEKHCIFLCSNETGELKEPLVNRCIPFIFDDYSIEEIEGIIKSNLEVPLEYRKEIALSCQKNPRIAKKICQTLGYIFQKNYPNSVEELRSIVINILQIENGLNLEQRKYINFLQKVERASLDLISSALRIDKKTIQKDIEPYLVRTDRIRITSRGRTWLQ